MRMCVGVSNVSHYGIVYESRDPVMPLNHGNKFYCQLLIDPNRYKLAEQLAQLEGKKVTAYLRDLVYAGLALRSADYTKAEKDDSELWKQSVQRRVQGRMRSKQGEGVSEIDA
jgi:hypothetical protein